MAFIRKHILKKIALLDALNREKFNTRRPGFIYMYLDRLRGIQCIPPKTVLTVGTWSISSCEIRLLDAFDVHMPCKNNLNFLVIKILSFCVLNFENRFFYRKISSFQIASSYSFWLDALEQVNNSSNNKSVQFKNNFKK